MVSCRAPGWTNWVDKNYNIIALVTIIIILLSLNYGIFRILAYSIPETYSKSKSWQIYKIMRHIQNQWSGILTDIKAFRDNQNSV